MGIGDTTTVVTTDATGCFLSTTFATPAKKNAGAGDKPRVVTTDIMLTAVRWFGLA